jgi:hypothetical protein
MTWDGSSGPPVFFTIGASCSGNPIAAINWSSLLPAQAVIRFPLNKTQIASDLLPRLCAEEVSYSPIQVISLATAPVSVLMILRGVVLALLKPQVELQSDFSSSKIRVAEIQM